MSEKLLAAGSVTLMAAGSLLGATAAQAATAADCGTHTGATVSLINGTICDVVYDEVGEFSFLAPTGITTFEAVLIGGGNGTGTETVVEQPGYFLDYYGYSGQVAHYVYTDVTSSLVGFVGDGGTHRVAVWENSLITFPVLGTDGENSVLGANSAYGSTLRESDLNCTWVGPAISASDLVGADNPLFPAIPGEDLLASSGDIFANASDRPTLTYGSGGSVGGTTYEDGASGAVIIRWMLDDDLASTGVDASAIGIGAGGLLAGGVALGAVAAVRRARSTR